MERSVFQPFLRFYGVGAHVQHPVRTTLHVSTLLEILERPYCKTPQLGAFNVVSTLLEILARDALGQTPFEVLFPFQPFLRFWPSVCATQKETVALFQPFLRFWASTYGALLKYVKTFQPFLRFWTFLLERVYGGPGGLAFQPFLRF